MESNKPIYTFLRQDSSLGPVPPAETPFLIEFKSGLNGSYSPEAPMGTAVIMLPMNVSVAQFYEKIRHLVINNSFAISSNFASCTRTETPFEVGGQVYDLQLAGIRAFWESGHPANGKWLGASWTATVQTDEELTAVLRLMVARGRKDRLLAYFDKPFKPVL